MKLPFSRYLSIGIGLALLFPTPLLTQSNFNPSFIISDPEMQDYQSWGPDDIQKFLNSKGSYLSTAEFADITGVRKKAADIIYDAAQTYQINPKFLLVTLQKEQSLVTDDSPTQKQLDWATGYAVCDGCYLNDPKVQKNRGFSKQVDGSAGIIRWYYQNQDKSIVKKKDTPIRIDDEDVTPASWATAFLYTYTPHLHGNANFWRIWNTWFDQMYPNGTLLKITGAENYWLIDNGMRRHFKTKTALITRYDPKLAISIDEVDLQNYQIGPEIVFPNYSLLRANSSTYLVDYDTLRPFASDEVVSYFGFNPEEIDEIDPSEIAGYKIGQTITPSSTAPQGVIYRITDAPNTYYLLKDNKLYPIIDKSIIDTNFKNLPQEKHKMKELAQMETADTPIIFGNGTLLQIADSPIIYVMEDGKKRPLADDDTFLALGYKKSNIINVSNVTALSIPTGERIFVNNSLVSARNKYLGDSESAVSDLYGKATAAAYLVAEYPSGRIISGKNIDTRRSIASLTKLLTAYESLRSDFKLTGQTVYDKTSYNSEGGVLKLATGDKLRNKDIFYSMLVGSDNSAARMVAANTSDGEDGIIRKINLRLEEWGADYTSVTDPTGLEASNKSTARDLLKIFTKVLENKNMKDALSSPSYTFSELSSKDKTRSHSFKNTNQIVNNVPLSKRSYKILATKTGYTDEASSTLVMLVESKKTKKQYVVVSLGNPNYAHRFEEPNKIAEWITTQKVTIANSKK